MEQQWKERVTVMAAVQRETRPLYSNRKNAQRKKISAEKGVHKQSEINAVRDSLKARERAPRPLSNTDGVGKQRCAALGRHMHLS